MSGAVSVFIVAAPRTRTEEVTAVSGWPGRPPIAMPLPNQPSIASPDPAREPSLAFRRP